MKIGRAAVIVVGLLILGLGIYSVGHVLTHGWGGAVITMNPPSGYTMKVSAYGPQDTWWRLEKAGNNYAVKSELKVWAQSPLVPMTWGKDENTLLSGYKTRVNKDKQQRPKGITVSGDRETVLNGTRFVGFQTQEARPKYFLVVQYVAFEVRGRHYNGTAVFHFAGKRASPANLKIAEAEWRRILASIR